MKPSIPKGTRDFLPVEVQQRAFIMNTIKSIFEKHAFMPIETPAMEDLQTLTGKYGEEGDQLLFKILNNGDFLSKADANDLNDKNSRKILPSISKRGLRYDLTVPLARYVVMHQNDLKFPFKRYQIQPVWRADRPQKGRYQEFYQCDVDIIGSNALMYEAELISIFDEAYQALNLDVTIRLNNRKILQGLFEHLNIDISFIDFTVLIDKIDKIGHEGLRKLLIEKNIVTDKIDLLIKLLNVKSVSELSQFIGENPTAVEGIKEHEKIMSYLKNSKIKNKIEFDLSLARGLNYYTGCIFEVISNEVKIGSISGGGRYDNLTEVFGLKGVSGVGISFGIARIYDALVELNRFPETVGKTCQLLLICLDESNHVFAFEQANKLREMGINVDLYPSAAKMKKQLKYANDLNIPFVGIIGEEEAESGKITIKRMVDGEQQTLGINTISSYLNI